MKKISYLVILLFIANTTFAQTTGILSVNFQEIVNNTNPHLSSVEEHRAFRKSGIISQGITQFHNGITRADAERFGKEAGDSAQKMMKRAVVAINRATEKFAPKGHFTDAVYEKNSALIESSIKVGVFDFHGQSVQMTGNIWAGNDLVSGIGMVNHLAVDKLECFYFDFPEGKFPFAARGCYNGLGDNAVLSVLNRTTDFIAEIPSTPNTPNKPNNQQANNPGNTGFTAEQLIALANALKPTVFVNNSSNNSSTNTVTAGGTLGTSGTSAKGVPNSPFGDGWTPLTSYTLPTSIANTPSTVTSSTTTATNTAACTTCGSAIPTADLALIERQNQEANRLLAENNALTAKSNKIAKSNRDWAIADFVFDRAEFAVDQLEKTGVIKLPNQGGNVFNTYTTNNTGTVATTDGAVDFNNGCPTGTTWNGFICQ